MGGAAGPLPVGTAVVVTGAGGRLEGGVAEDAEVELLVAVELDATIGSLPLSYIHCMCQDISSDIDWTIYPECRIEQSLHTSLLISD